MGVLGARGSTSEVTSASVVSFNDGLPQGEPSFQRETHEHVDDLVASLDQLTLGRSAAASGQLRLSLDEPASSAY